MAPAPSDALDASLSAPRAVQSVIAVGGGRGGVGKSIVAVNVAVYLAQLGRTVALVDSDPAGAELHTLLGVQVPVSDPGREDDQDEELPLLATAVPGLRLLPQTYARGSTLPDRPGRKARWVSRLRHLDVDHVIVDLGAGTAPATLDLFLSADVGVCVTTPEPPSVETTYRFLRALYMRSLRRLLIKDRFKLRLVERAQSTLPPLPSPLELVRCLARFDSTVAELAASELAQLRPRLVVNGTRLRTDGDLGSDMSELGERYLGARFDYVGHVEQDDSVWLSVVRRHPLLIDSPTSKSARNLERVARRLLAVATSRERSREPQRVAMSPEELNLYDVLWTHRGATDEEVRRAYKRQRELFQPDSLALTSLMSEEQLREARARIEEAHDTLLDPLRRRAYDVSTFPELDAAAPARDPALDSAIEAERQMLRQELERELNAETEFTGAMLAKVRESLGIQLDEIAGHTKIAAAHLRAIEQEDFASLPALVYTRGFVQQLARYLKLDPAQVSRTYLKRMREWKGAGS